ncbi:MAG: patatin-like phospholipase family protein [Bacteroidota bacterium]
MRHPLGICLAGGGARGIAHIGVLQALEEHGIVPEAISGSSMGAIVGALYAAGHSPQEMLTILEESSLLKLFKISLPTLGLTDNTYIIELLQKYIPEDDFSALQKTLFVCVTNLSSGRTEMIHEGPLSEIVAASASIPILFNTKQIGKDQYVDGGLLNNLPVEPLKATCKKVIGVNVTPVAYIEEEVSGLINLGYRTLDLVLWANVESRLRQCDVVIEPDTARFHLFELNKAEAIYQAGYEAAMAELTDLQRISRGKKAKTNPYRNRFAETELSERQGCMGRIKAWFGG